VAFEIAQESSMTVALYGALGQTVSYAARDAATVSIKIVMKTGSLDFPGAFDNPTAETQISARVLKSDVAVARRGDRLVDATGAEYVVDSVAEISAPEWLLTLRRCANG
jgi:hypothetical protein